MVSFETVTLILSYMTFNIESSHSHPTWHKEELGRKFMQKKLESFLVMFAAVKGPQQLFKHKILLQVKDKYVGRKVTWFIDVQLGHGHAIYPTHDLLTK